MEDEKNKNNSTVSVKIDSSSKKNEEKKILKGAKILIKDQKGKFSYIKGTNLLGEDEEIISSVTKKSTLNPSIVQKAVAQLATQKMPVPSKSSKSKVKVNSKKDTNDSLCSYSLSGSNPSSLITVFFDMIASEGGP